MLGLTPTQSHGPVGILVRTYSVKVCIGLIRVPLQDALNRVNSYYNLSKPSEKKVRSETKLSPFLCKYSNTDLGNSLEFIDREHRDEHL